MTASTRTFWSFFLPRFALAAVFTYIGFTGAGGDTATFLLLAGYLRDLFVDPDNASLILRMERHDLFIMDTSYYRLAARVQQLYNGNLATLFGDSGLSVVVLHAGLYMIWDNPFVVVLLQCVASALAYTVFIRSNNLTFARSWLIWNPASLFFCATHFKESFTETALLLLCTRTTGLRWIYKIPVVVFLGFLRLEYLVFVAIIYAVFRFKRLGNVAWPKLVAGMLFLFLVMPAAYADWMISNDSAGWLYSVVYANEVTRRLLGPIVGMLLPVPFVLIPFDSLWGLFYNVYGVAYYYVGIQLLRLDWSSLRFRGNTYLNASLIILALISYRFTGQSGTKDRYFAPFFPLLVVGYCLKRKERDENLLHAAPASPRPAENSGVTS